MRATAGEAPYHSRFQVLTDGEPAWARDDRGTYYRFDGFSFSRRRRRDQAFLVVPSWQTPPYGWVCGADSARPVWRAAPAREPSRVPTASRDYAA